MAWFLTITLIVIAVIHWQISLIVSAILAMMFGVILIIGGIVGYYQGRERKPNIFTEYIKAKKQKICPLITIIDPNREK